jgi:hypothetical protein
VCCKNSWKNASLIADIEEIRERKMFRTDSENRKKWIEADNNPVWEGTDK